MAGSRWRRWLVRACGLAVVAGTLGGVAAVLGARYARDVWTDPARRSALLSRVLDGTGVAVELGDVEVVESDRWVLLVERLHVQTAAVDVRASHAETGIPAVLPMLLFGRFDLGDVRVDGLSVTVPRRPLPAATGGGWPLRVVIDHLLVRDGTLALPASGGLPEARATGVRADLRKVRVVGGTGLVGGRGQVEVRSWRTGAIEVDQVVMSDVRLSRGRYRLGGGRLQIAGGGAEGSVVIDGVDGKRPAVHAELRLRDGDLATLVQAATGQRSPVSGRLSGTFTVDTGGDRGPGEGRTLAEVRLEDGALLLGPAVPSALRAALKIAPFLELRHGKVWLGPTEASLRFSGGRVDIDRLVHEGKGRPLAARGSVVGRELDLVVRLVPRKKADRRKGTGLVVGGTAGALSVRRATAAELKGVGDAP